MLNHRSASTGIAFSFHILYKFIYFLLNCIEITKRGRKHARTHSRIEWASKEETNKTTKDFQAKKKRFEKRSDEECVRQQQTITRCRGARMCIRTTIGCDEDGEGAFLNYSLPFAERKNKIRVKPFWWDFPLVFLLPTLLPWLRIQSSRHKTTNVILAAERSPKYTDVGKNNIIPFSWSRHVHASFMPFPFWRMWHALYRYSRLCWQIFVWSRSDRVDAAHISHVPAPFYLFFNLTWCRRRRRPIEATFLNCLLEEFARKWF